MNDFVFVFFATVLANFAIYFSIYLSIHLYRYLRFYATRLYYVFVDLFITYEEFKYAIRRLGQTCDNVNNIANNINYEFNDVVDEVHGVIYETRDTVRNVKNQMLITTFLQLFITSLTSIATVTRTPDESPKCPEQGISYRPYCAGAPRHIPITTPSNYCPPESIEPLAPHDRPSGLMQTLREKLSGAFSQENINNYLVPLAVKAFSYYMKQQAIREQRTQAPVSLFGAQSDSSDNVDAEVRLPTEFPVERPGYKSAFADMKVNRRPIQITTVDQTTQASQDIPTELFPIGLFPRSLFTAPDTHIRVVSPNNVNIATESVENGISTSVVNNFSDDDSDENAMDSATVQPNSCESQNSASEVSCNTETSCTSTDSGISLGDHN